MAIIKEKGGGRPIFLKAKSLFIMIPIFLFFLFPTKADARSFTIDAIDINAFIYPDGDLYVEELYTYTFDGSFNGTTRIIGDDDFKGVAFFEGYQVPHDAEMGKITPEMVTPLRIEIEDYTYKVHRSYKDETEKVFYRYRLKDVMRKYEDIGEFYWRFFDEMGDEDLNHLRIFVQLAEDDQLPDDSHGFLHDLTNGKMEMTDKGLYYENEKLPGGEPFELRLLFPSNYLSEMDYTEQREMLPTLLQEEADYQERLTTRNQWLPISENISFAIFIALFIFALYAIFYPKRLLRFFGKATDFTEIEKMDSFTLTALHRKLRFVPEDINAVLFQLYQKGYVSVERIPTSQELLKDVLAPNYTFTFILEKKPSDLPDHEQYLIDWLFTETENGKRSFSLDQIPLRINQNPKLDWQKRAERAKQTKQFGKHFKEWKKRASKDSELYQWIKPVKARKIFNFGIIPIWLLWCFVNLYMGMGDRQDVYLGGTAMAFGYSMLIVLWKGERVISTLYFAFLLIAFSVIGLDSGMEHLHATTVPLLLISAFLPNVTPTYYAMSYFKGMKKWVKGLKKKQLQLPSEQRELEITFQHAIALGQAHLFKGVYGEQIEATTTSELYPFLIAPMETASIYSYYSSGFRSTYSSSSSSGGSSGSSGGSGGGGGAGAF